MYCVRHDGNAFNFMTCVDSLMKQDAKPFFERNHIVSFSCLSFVVSHRRLAFHVCLLVYEQTMQYVLFSTLLPLSRHIVFFQGYSANLTFSNFLAFSF